MLTVFTDPFGVLQDILLMDEFVEEAGLQIDSALELLDASLEAFEYQEREVRVVNDAFGVENDAFPSEAVVVEFFDEVPCNVG